MPHEETDDEREARRAKAKKEAHEDLDKPIPQLVIDVHDGAFDPSTSDEHKLLYATRRMVSMMGRVALEHERSSNWLVALTWVLGGLTVALLVATLLLLRVAHQTDERLHQIHELVEAHAHQPAAPNNAEGK